MPILTPDAGLPQLRSARRVLVAGPSGAGKTTMAQQLSRALGVDHHEIDALFHGPDWQPRESFVADVEAVVAQDGWVTEWQYTVVRERLLERADALVWLDLPRRVVMRQVITRTLRRRLLREELRNGNREGPLREVFTDRDHIVRWAWAAWAPYPSKVRDAAERRPELLIVRVRSRGERRRLVEALHAEVVCAESSRRDASSSEAREERSGESGGRKESSASRRMSPMRLREIITSRTARAIRSNRVTRARAERR